MALYQPRNMQPYLQCIDATKENTFSCQINGDECVQYEVDLHAMGSQPGNNGIGWRGYLNEPLYNGDVLSFQVYEPDFLTNGRDYTWSIRLLQSEKTMKVAQGTIGGCSSSVITINRPTEANRKAIFNHGKYIKIGTVLRKFDSYDTTLNQFHLAEDEMFSLSLLTDGTTVTVYDNEAAQDINLIYTGTLLNNTTTKICLNPPGWKDNYKLKIYKSGGEVLEIDTEDKIFESLSTYSLVLKTPLSEPLSYGDMYEMYSNYVDSNPATPFYCRSDPSLNILGLENSYEFFATPEYRNTVDITWHSFDYNKFKECLDYEEQTDERLYEISYHEDGSFGMDSRPIEGGLSSAYTNLNADPVKELQDLGFNFTVNSDSFPTGTLVYVTTSQKQVGVNSKEFTFRGSYYQEEKVGIKSHRWELWIKNVDNFTLLEDTGDIYNTNLVYTYNAFRAGNIYAIQLSIEDTLGRYFETEQREFLVNYMIPQEVEIRPTITANCEKTAIDLTWGDVCTYEDKLDTYVTITEYSDGTYTYSDQPNKVYKNGEVVSTTVNPLAYHVSTRSAGVGIGYDKKGYVKVGNNDYIYFDTWEKETVSGTIEGNMDVSENFCITWYQRFYKDFAGGRIYSNSFDINTVLPNSVEINGWNTRTLTEHIRAAFPNPEERFFTVGHTGNTFWFSNSLQASLDTSDKYTWFTYVDDSEPPMPVEPAALEDDNIMTAATETLSPVQIEGNLETIGIFATVTGEVPDGAFITIEYPRLEEYKVIMDFERTDEDGQVHVYKVWLTQETDLDNKYAFKYDLDGITGTYVWDSRRQNFALQTSNSVNVAEDYIFADVLDDTSQQWADEKYFLENKTRDDILQSSWWKFVMTKDRLFIKKGEV